MNRLTFDEFLERACAVHGDKYDYSQAKFISASHKITIVCPIHGPFVQKPQKHLKGQGCIHCGVAKRGLGKRSNTEDFIAKANKIHGEGRYDYSEVVYETAIKKVKIICPQHGPFMQVPNSHLNGNGCPECAKILNSIDKKSNTAEFIEKAKAIHGDKYDYSKVEYKLSRSPVIIKCNKCGSEFTQLPHYHLNGYGCQACACKDPKAERDIYGFFMKNICSDSVRNDRKALCGKELDVYSPSAGVAVEHTGNYWHSARIRDREIETHLKNKFMLCEEKGIRLYTIYEDEWAYNRALVKSVILRDLGKLPKKSLDNPVIKKVDNEIAREFLTEHHHRGCSLFNNAYGLFVGGELVSVAAFCWERGTSEKTGGSVTLIRYCDRSDIIVDGSLSMLIDYFKKNNQGIKKIIAYSDNRYPYESKISDVGFSFCYDVEPDYFYIRGSSKYAPLRERKQKYFKSEFKKKGIDVEGKTEEELAKSVGMYRLYDAGKKCWELKLD